MTKTLEDYATDYLEAIRLEVHTDWLLADIIAEVMDNCIGGGATPKEARAVIVDFATRVRQSGHSAYTLEHKGNVAKIFPEDSGMRHEDVAFSIYGVCERTADPYGWLAKALEMDWKVRQLRAAITEASGRQDATIKAILEHLVFFGLGTEAQIAALNTADPLVLRGIKDMLGGLRRMVNGKGYLGDAPQVLWDLAVAIERWRMRW